MPDSDREKWNGKYALPDARWENPSRVLLELQKWLPDRGRALDLAGGAGRNALWLAKQGLDVTLADISDVGLELARQKAQNEHVQLNTVQTDLEEEPTPPGPWDLILSICYLWRPLLRQLPAFLNPGGTIIVVQPTTTNLQRHARPPKPFLLENRELPTLFGGLPIEWFHEGWSADGRFDAVIVARNI